MTVTDILIITGLAELAILCIHHAATCIENRVHREYQRRLGRFTQ